MTLVRLEHDGPLAVLTLDSPPLNLFDDRLLGELEERLDDLADSPPRGLLLRAEGRAVSGGLDVGPVLDGIDAAAGARLWSRLLAITHRVERLPCPTVFAAHALTLTAAFELGLACDLILAARSSRFGLVERVVGLTPAMGGTQRIAERAGAARARELVMTGALYDAATLERWNVVNRVLDDEGFDAACRAFAADLASGPTRAMAATKEIVRAYLDGGVAQADEVVPSVAGALFDTDDVRRAVRSFLQRGPGHAVFEGR